MTYMSEKTYLLEADQHFDRKEFVQALHAYEIAYFLSPNDIEARTGVALSLFHVGKYAEAVPALLELLTLLPDSEQLSLILAESLNRCGRVAEAVHRLSVLVSNSPDNIDAQVRLGRIYLDMEQYPDANRCLTAALDIEPNHVEALGYIGMMMIKHCQFDNALMVLQKAYELSPGDILVLNNLGRACKLMGDHDKALAWYQEALKVDQNHPVVITNYLFTLNYCDGLDSEFITSEHVRLAPHFLNSAVPEITLKQIGPSSERLRIGYVSGDFYTHSVSYFIEPILQNHNYQRFEVYCYSLGLTNDVTTKRLKALPCQWRDMTTEPPEGLIKQIREDRIDILVDLSGLTADNRLTVFANRSAPIQLSWIGYPNTSGLANMDYYLTDCLCDPPGMTDHLFIEKLWRLPRVFCCYLPPIEFPAISPPPFLTNGYITFGSFNNFAKVTTRQIALWANILRSVPGSRLYLKSMALGDNSVKNRVLEIFAAEGVLADRILMRVVTITPLEHLQEYSKVDIALDTFPYHGATTTCEALWMGIPVITRAGVSHVSRVGVSLLQQVGCLELAAQSAEEYVERAVSLAGSSEKLILMRNNLRMLMAGSALMDQAGVTREVEEAYARMFEAACKERCYR